MRRREFITVAGAAIGWPLVAQAQQPMPVIGFLHSASREPYAKVVDAFRRGLTENGYIEGENITV